MSIHTIISNKKKFKLRAVQLSRILVTDFASRVTNINIAPPLSGHQRSSTELTGALKRPDLKVFYSGFNFGIGFISFFSFFKYKIYHMESCLESSFGNLKKIHRPSYFEADSSLVEKHLK